MAKVYKFLRDNAVRVYAVVVAALALVVHYVPNLPSDLVLGLVAAVIALLSGETVQRVENRKSRETENFGEDKGLSTL